MPAAPAAPAPPAAAAAAAGRRLVGPAVLGWSPRPEPGIPAGGLAGRTVFLAPLDAAAHADALWEACSLDPHPPQSATAVITGGEGGATAAAAVVVAAAAEAAAPREGGSHMWDYLPAGPWPHRAAFDEDLRQKAASTE